MSKVVRARTAGFCMGVMLALNKLDALMEDGTVGRPIFTLGPIIHNPQVLEEYARKGVVSTDSPDDIPPGATVVIRAHGVPRNILASLAARGVHIVDATCPRVGRAQFLIADATQAGRTLLLYGEESHPEVKGLLSHAGAGAIVFESMEELAAFPLAEGNRYCLAAQTTQDRQKFERIAENLASAGRWDMKVLHTICDATRQRQAETINIARDTDFMVVVGGFDSGNTRRLVQVAADQRKPCLHVESARDLPVEDLKRIPRIGLTAGASTPKYLIDEIHRLLEPEAERAGAELPSGLPEGGESERPA